MLIRIANISKGGFFLKTSNPLPIGRHAVLTFRVNDTNEVIAQVEVVWHSRGPQVLSRTSLSGMGTKLLDIVKGDDIFDLCLQLDK
jgi:Tfp pilus assembly protein PilZ